jgi:HEAT repeat protein
VAVKLLVRSLPIACVLLSAGAWCADDRQLSNDELITSFDTVEYFWQQLEVAKEIAVRGERGALPKLEKWLVHEDRHIRGNAAIVFAKLGEDRGFDIICAILFDLSDRPEGQGIAGIAGGPGYNVERQIHTDRYYAAHLLGELRDPRAVRILIPFQFDLELGAKVRWSLSQIGEEQVARELIKMLDDPDPHRLVLTIRAVEGRRVSEAAPRLRELVKDQRSSNYDDRLTVSEAAQSALANLGK